MHCDTMCSLTPSRTGKLFIILVLQFAISKLLFLFLRKIFYNTHFKAQNTYPKTFN